MLSILQLTSPPLSSCGLSGPILMNVQYLHPPADQRDLEDLRALIEQSVVNGKIRLDQCLQIQVRMTAEGKISAEALALFQELIWSRVDRGELQYLWF